MTPKHSGFLKLPVFLIIFAFVIFTMYWLWQRQPKSQDQNLRSQTENSKELPAAQTANIKPQNFSVLASTTIKLEGESKPNEYVAIYSNDANYLAKTKNDGKFEQTITLTLGLNLIEVIVFSISYDEQLKHQLTYWVINQDIRGGAKTQDTAKTVFAGTIKTIFDNILTIQTSSGEKSVRVTAGTQLDVPEIEDEEESTRSALENIRVGDYAIALGDLSDETLNAKKLTVARKDKPQITKLLIVGKVLTNVRQNLFSAKSVNDNKITEFTLNKSSQIMANGNEANSSDITKNRDSFIFFHQEGSQKLVDLIFLIP